MVKTITGNKRLALLVDIFIYLLFFDAIFRKWILPNQSFVIMPIKMAVMVLIVLIGRKYVKFTAWEVSFALVGTLLFIITLIFGHQNVLVDLWGCYPYWFALTGSYILGKILSADDVIRIGKFLVYISIAHNILTCIQSVLPVSHFLNATANDSIHDMSMTAADLAGGYRPPGIMMSTSLSMLLAISAYAFMLVFYYTKNIMKEKILFIGIGLTFIGGVCATSRTYVMCVLGMTAYFLFLCSNPQMTKKVLKIFSGVIVVALILMFTPQGEKAFDNMMNRFDNASQSNIGNKGNTFEGTIYDIYNRNIAYNIEAMIDPHTIDGEGVPLLGYGQGMSTQTGGKLMGNTKNSGFALAEWDGLRIVCESGIVFGWIVIIIRMGYVLRFVGHLSYYKRKKRLIALLLWPCFFIGFYLITTWGNAANLCFAIFIAGLFMSSRKIKI